MMVTPASRALKGQEYFFGLRVDNTITKSIHENFRQICGNSRFKKIRPLESRTTAHYRALSLFIAHHRALSRTTAPGVNYCL